MTTTKKSNETVAVAILPPAQKLTKEELGKFHDDTEKLLINNVPGGDDYYD